MAHNPVTNSSKVSDKRKRGRRALGAMALAGSALARPVWAGVLVVLARR